MLDERKKLILEAIIGSYLLNAEPIGSRTISKNYNLGVSSATIRNEMSDLEDLGLLSKAHSSSGRIPSDKAYRLYVNNLIESLSMIGFSDYKDLLDRSLNGRSLIEEAINKLSNLTGYTTLAIIYKSLDIKLEKIYILEESEETLLLVMVYDNDKIYYHHIKKDYTSDIKSLIKINFIFNDLISGMYIEKIPSFLDKVDTQNSESLDNFKIKLKEAVKDDIGKLKKYDLILDGVSSIFKFPEYSDINKVREFISLIENKETIIKALVSGDAKINIAIGEENEDNSFKGLSIIDSFYMLENGLHGKIGLLGPTRMDYDSAIHYLLCLINELNTGSKSEGGRKWMKI